MTRRKSDADKSRGTGARKQGAAPSNPPRRKAGRTPVPVVGMGASAGGLESLREFFSAMPADSGMAFVVVQHLQHGRRSMMADVLSSYTDMPVTPAADSVPVEANHVYVIPSDALLTIQEGKLHVETWKGEAPRRMPIDTFLCSLAEDQGRNAVAIVMSGAGSDGTLGVRAVKEHGGLALAEALGQPGGRVGFESMPQSAVATGLVDFVVAASSMPRHLVDYAGHLSQVTESNGVEKIEHEASAYLREICAILLARKGRDFRHYKSSTLIRRIQRRMQVLQIESAGDYVQSLRGDSQELDRLSRELLISVTSFFRDPDAFEALKTLVIEAMVQERNSDQHLRIWVPGCGTGEEAYSIAILVQEVRSQLETFPPVQIFATDIDEIAVETARIGRYPKSVAEDIAPERLRRFFVEEEDQYRVSESIRDMCIFSVHDLIQNPPFSRIDVISCRNVLIYLDTELQKRLIPIFHYALRESGCLLLGASENVTQHRNLFATVDKKHRIFRRRERVARAPLEFPVPASARQADVRRVPATSKAAKADWTPDIEKLVLDRYGPAYVVIDENFDVIQYSRGTGKYLEQPAGAPRSNIFEMARAGLRTKLRAAINEASESRKEVVRLGLSVTTNATAETIDILVRPVTAKGEAPLYVVVFRRTASRGEAPRPSPEIEDQGERMDDGEAEDRLRQLEQELAATREDLQTTIEEMETANEELQSANEELLSMNEELQSSNEELETSKEEIQSVNEELETVNQELSHKVTESDRVNTDLRNLLHSTDVATVFLDREARIKWFAPAAKRLFNLIRSDVGRPITDITAQFDPSGLREDLDTTLRTEEISEREVEALDGEATFVMRVLPYRDAEGRADGLVVTFQDISRLKAVERQGAEKARQAQLALADLQALLDVVPVGIAMAHDALGHDVRVNRHGAAMLESREWLVVGGERQHKYRVCQGDEAIPFEDTPLQRVLRTGETIVDFECRIEREDGTSIDVAVSAAPLHDKEGNIRGAVTAFADVTEAKAAQRRQHLLVAALQHRVKNVLAAVRSLERETRETSETLDEFTEKFEGRLDALAMTETMLARTPEERVDLHELMGEALPPAMYKAGTVTIDGPAVRLTRRAAQLMSLALNELTTNAIKFGALSCPEGRIVASWRPQSGDGDGVLRFQWRESGVTPPPQAPSGGGFGLELIEKGLPYELGGSAEIEFAPTGIVCAIAFPLENHVVSIEEEPPEVEVGEEE